MSSLTSFYLIFLRQGLSLTCSSPIQQGWPANELSDLPASALPGSEVKGVYHHTLLLWGDGGPNADPQASAAGALPAEPSSQPFSAFALYTE